MEKKILFLIIGIILFAVGMLMIKLGNTKKNNHRVIYDDKLNAYGLFSIVLGILFLGSLFF
jgi:hypothetical protein